MNDAQGLETAILLARNGDKKAARQLLEGIVFAEPANERAWIWLADTIPDPDLRLAVLEQCLKANPDSRIARTALERIKRIASTSLAADKKAPEEAPQVVETPTEVSDQNSLKDDTIQKTAALTPERESWGWRIMVILLLTLFALLGTNLWLWLTPTP